MQWDYGLPEHFSVPDHGLFICNEGNFQYSNASLSYYNPDSNSVINEAFFRANGYRLGDVANSCSLHNDKLWIVVNNSHVIFAVDINSFKELGRIENLTSPRFIHFVNDEKAYVTQLWDNRIFIVNPKRYEIIGHISVPDMDMENGSTEQMVQFGKYIYCTCWSYQNRILKIDSETDSIVAQLTIGIQPRSIVIDKNQKLWVITDGGYSDSPYGSETPALFRIDAQSFAVEKKFLLSSSGDAPSCLQLNVSADTLYWINRHIWRMDINTDALPVAPFLKSDNSRFYALSVSPHNSELYVADAIDYQQQGVIMRYSSQAFMLDKFYVGITPGAFCWK